MSLSDDSDSPRVLEFPPVVDTSHVDPKEISALLTSERGAVILVNKPYGETSFHVVSRIRHALSRIAGIKRVRVGHAGTLDPLATGLLLIATRGATKSIATLTNLDKKYVLRLRLGIRSPSYDLETKIEAVSELRGITEEKIKEVVQSFQGASEQMPPAFSAIKQAGKPVYLRARAGDDVQLSTRSVEVHSIAVTGIALPCVDIQVHVSKGTYIRSIVRDIGEKLAVGAVLTELERTQVGAWNVLNAFDLSDLLKLLHSNSNNSE